MILTKSSKWGSLTSSIGANRRGKFGSAIFPIVSKMFFCKTNKKVSFMLDFIYLCIINEVIFLNNNKWVDNLISLNSFILSYNE